MERSRILVTVRAYARSAPSSFHIVRDQGSHVIEESQEMSARYGSSTGKQTRISECSARFDIQGNDDPEMKYFNDYLLMVESAQKLGEVYAFDAASAAFI